MTRAHHCPALFLAASAAGQGRTTLVAGVARYHRRQGRRVRVFKTGPDFLDPKILERASGSPVSPLDLWMVGESRCRAKLHAAAAESDLILIEGVMGLYDGKPSGADLAERFAVPVVVMIDAGAMCQTFGALAFGLTHFRSTLPIAGVVANRVDSAPHADRLRESLPPDVPFLGVLPCIDRATLPVCHQSPVQAEDIADLDARLDATADAIEATELARLPPAVAFAAPDAAERPPRLLEGRRIAVASDAAFSFVYPDNLRLLRDMGAELQEFSPMEDERVEADAIYLPGGYPEHHLHDLERNLAMRSALLAHAAAGRPIHAECGGMLYLLDSLTDKDGGRGLMVGLLPGHAKMQGQPVALGMQSIEFPQGTLRGHSFHHSATETRLVPAVYGQHHADGSRGEPFYRHGAVRASYLHLYFPSAPEAAAQLFLP